MRNAEWSGESQELTSSDSRLQTPDSLLVSRNPIVLRWSGGAGGLVVLAGFKPVAGLREAAWVGSIPTRLRQEEFGELGELGGSESLEVRA